MKPKIAVFSGPLATISNSPTLVTGNKGRLPNEAQLPGNFDPLVPQMLYEPVKVKIRRFSAHPLEEDARAVYHDGGKDYYEVELRPEDGLYPLPYVARRSDGSPQGVPFEDEDLSNPAINYGGRFFHYPDASRVFEEIDRTITGRTEQGAGNALTLRADFDFVRALPSGGYVARGERPGVDFFPYKPAGLGRPRPRYRDLARIANEVHRTLSNGEYSGAIWLEGSPIVEETMYWLNLLIDTDLPICGNAAMRAHGQLSADGDRNILDSVDYILSGCGVGLGAVGIQDEQIFAAREFRKGDDRPGGYKASGGHGGILGNMGPPVTIWFKPIYKHTSSSEVNFTRLPDEIEFLDSVDDDHTVRIPIKTPDGFLRPQAIPRVHIVKAAGHAEEDETINPDQEVDIIARIHKGLAEQQSDDPDLPKLHGFVLEGVSTYGSGTGGQMEALNIATLSGMPVVRVGRGDPDGPASYHGRYAFTIWGSNLDSTKASILLMAAMLKLGRLPRAKDPRHPTKQEREAILTKLAQFEEIFKTH